MAPEQTPLVVTSNTAVLPEKDMVNKEKKHISSEFRSRFGCDPPFLLNIECGMMEGSSPRQDVNMRSEQYPYCGMGHLTTSPEQAAPDLRWGHKGKGCAQLIVSSARIIWNLAFQMAIKPNYMCTWVSSLQSCCGGAALQRMKAHQASVGAWESGGSACPGRWAPTAPQTMLQS